jgi:hypothetical protein
VWRKEEVIDNEERQSIINEAVEKALLVLPEVVGNLMMSQARNQKLIKDFYTKHPDLVSNEHIVAATVEKIEGDNPGLKYEEILAKSVPLIRERMKTAKLLDTKSAGRPNRNLSFLDVPKNNVGEL